jgi:preprotein translocase subunit Sss1
MANKVATILGIGFLLVGILGFVMPSMLGMHLTVAHHIIHLATGAVSLWLGLKGSPSAARTFCISFGAVYLLLGVAGFVIGSSADPSAGVPGPSDARMMKVIPGVLELGTMDHIVHILLGAIYLVGGLADRAAKGTTARVA